MLKIKVDYKSFVQKGLEKNNEDFQVVLVCGAQGSGKNYLTIYKSEQNSRNVYTNVKSYESNNKEVFHFGRLEEIYNIYEKNLLFIVDECAKKFPKDCKIDKSFYGWLQQSRKCNRYVYLIFQEYIMVPQWLRGVASRVYVTRKLPFLPIHITTFGIPVLDSDTKEWGVQELSILIYKRNKSIGDLYDTYEIIQEL